VKELQKELYKKYKMDIPYHIVFRGKEKALDIINGKWDDNYNLFPSYKADLLRCAHGSVVELDTEVHKGKYVLEDSLLHLNQVLMVSS
jgi:hypothetical protein